MIFLLQDLFVTRSFCLQDLSVTRSFCHKISLSQDFLTQDLYDTRSFWHKLFLSQDLSVTSSLCHKTYLQQDFSVTTTCYVSYSAIMRTCVHAIGKQFIYVYAIVETKLVLIIHYIILPRSCYDERLYHYSLM